MRLRESVEKIFMLAALVSLVAGCAPLQPSGCHKTSAMGSCSSGRWDDQDEWGVQARGIKAAIEEKIAEPERWKGKKCRLHMEFDQDGRALRVSTSDGDKGYCEAVRSAAQKAKFPGFSNLEVYRGFQEVGFDMRGEVGIIWNAAFFKKRTPSSFRNKHLSCPFLPSTSKPL